MLMTNFLKDRESIRDFKNTKIDPGTIENIKKELEKLEEEAGKGLFELKFFENGKNVSEGFKGEAGYSGVMIESPHYVSLNIKKETDGALMHGAYSLEKLTSILHGMDIATCWITLNDVSQDMKKQVLGEENLGTEYLLALGYARPRNPFMKESFSDRKSIQELVFQGEIGSPVDLDTLEERGLLDLFYYVRYAPSTKNLQPWRFLINGNKVVLLMDENNVNFADAGIMMYYFEALANILGVRTVWEEVDQEVENGFRRIAELTL